MKILSKFKELEETDKAHVWETKYYLRVKYWIIFLRDQDKA